MIDYKHLRPLTDKEFELIRNLLRQGKTYHWIVNEVKGRLGSTIKTCHVAEVKRDCGIGTRGAWNSGKRYSVK